MHLFTLSFVFVALTSAASTTLASRPGSYPGQTPDGLIWKRYEPTLMKSSPPPPPHPAELAPRSIHRSRPSRYHSSSSSSSSRREQEEGGGGKRRLMGSSKFKQVTANEVKKRALTKAGSSPPRAKGKRVYFDVKRSHPDDLDEGEQAGEGHGDDEVEGWSWVDDAELVAVKNNPDLTWAQKMEVRMRKTRPLFAQV
ncbi:hypothetical protein JCM11491_005212 [Sporobolomyces phaffii]